MARSVVVYGVAAIVLWCCCASYPAHVPRHRLHMSTEYFLIPSTTAASTSSSSVAARVPPPTSPAPGKIITSTTTTSSVSRRGGGGGAVTFRDEAWVVPVAALSAVCMCLIGCFEVFVLCKAWRTTPSRRHLFLGQMLLLGLFSCATVAGSSALVPSPVTCALLRFGSGAAYALVFAALLVKCVFLISLNGGVYLPAPYQGLLLLFAVLIQVAIGVQWLVTAPPGTRTLAAGYPTLCRTPYHDMLLSLSYVLFLIVFVCVLAVKSRGIRDNYREATYIGLSVGCTVPIWLAWTLAGLAAPERHRDACLALGLVATAVVVFLLMFMPKGRQLAAMGKDGVFLEDREERFSSLSRAASGYSPSFFHFKPAKCAPPTPAKHHGHLHAPATVGSCNA